MRKLCIQTAFGSTKGKLFCEFVANFSLQHPSAGTVLLRGWTSGTSHPVVVFVILNVSRQLVCFLFYIVSQYSFVYSNSFYKWNHRFSLTSNELHIMNECPLHFMS